MKRLILASVALATAGLLATACGGEASGDYGMSSMSSSPAGSPSSTSADHNDQDAMFAMMMIPHHRQATEMAELADDRASSAGVKQLAKQILAAQEPEVQTMSGWLTSWGFQVPNGDMPSMNHGVEGMMSADEMKELEGMSGRAFDKAFLKMMIKHHEGAISMAKQEQNSGLYAPAKEMASSIESSQTAEITKMKQSLQGS